MIIRITDIIIIRWAVLQLTFWLLGHQNSLTYFIVIVDERREESETAKQ